jgi:tyrosyl-tRNA synthetase
MVKKLMTISDDLMWRYWELLTDSALPDIAKLRAEASAGRNPRDIKLDLAERIVADYHPASEAKAARDKWLSEVSEGQIPKDLVETAVSDPRLNRILTATGLAGSVSEADRLIKAGAVAVAAGASENLHAITVPVSKLEPGSYTIRAGKRWKRVVV